LSYLRKKIDEYIIVDETMIKGGSWEYVRLWVIIEHKDKEILSITTYLKTEKYMLVHREVPIEGCRKIQFLTGFNRWRHLVSTPSI
jgi:hypothetical protein